MAKYNLSSDSIQGRPGPDRDYVSVWGKAVVDVDGDFN